jgi:hypothetical protein
VAIAALTTNAVHAHGMLLLVAITGHTQTNQDVQNPLLAIAANHKMQRHCKMWERKTTGHQDQRKRKNNVPSGSVEA